MSGALRVGSREWLEEQEQEASRPPPMIVDHAHDSIVILCPTLLGIPMKDRWNIESQAHQALWANRLGYGEFKYGAPTSRGVAVALGGGEWYVPTCSVTVETDDNNYPSAVHINIEYEENCPEDPRDEL
jgi:hypothetical protein